MANAIVVTLEQAGPSASTARVREHTVLVDRPVAKGGSDRGPMGGELLLAALGGCFTSTLLAAIASREAALADVRVEVRGDLEDAPARFSAAHLHVRASGDGALLARLVTIAERSCIVANTLRGSVALTLSSAVEPA